MNKDAQIKNKGQLQNIVIIRTFAIISVVLYHSFCPWLKAWDCFETNLRPVYSYIFETLMVGRMPLFVSVSGYLFAHLFLDRGKYKSYKGFLKNKLYRLMLPAVTFMLISAITVGANWVDLVTLKTASWFLKMLFWCFVIDWVVLKYVKGSKLLIALCCACLLPFTPLVYFVGIDSFQKYYMFFLLGSIIYIYRDRYHFFQSNTYTIILGVLYISFASVALYCYSTDFNIYGDIIHTNKILIITRSLLRVLTIFLGFSIVDLYLRKNKNFKSSFFQQINSYSYGIYLIHIFITGTIKGLGYYNYVSDFCTVHDFIAPIIYFVLILSVSICVTILLKSSKFTSWSIGG